MRHIEEWQCQHQTVVSRLISVQQIIFTANEWGKGGSSWAYIETYFHQGKMHIEIAVGSRAASGRVALGKWTADYENKGSYMSIGWTQCIWAAGSWGFIRGQGDQKFSGYIQGGFKNIGDWWGFVAVKIAWDVEGKKIVKMQLIVYYLWVSF